jgi:predicted nucleotidyltransferase
MMKFGLRETDIERINHLLEQSDKVQKAIIYGSRAKGNYKPSSDIDLTLIAPDMSISELYQLENQIDDLLLPITVDMSLYHHISNPDLIEHIERVGKVFYQQTINTERI